MTEPDGDEQGAAVRKPYVAPEITRVPLKPEEAVLGACKTAGVGGPVSSDCTVPVGCSSFGS